MKRSIWLYTATVMGIVCLCVLNLLWGSVDVPVRDVLAVLGGQAEEQGVKVSWQYIILENRLPQTLTALFSGAALAVSGLLLQSAFRNPLAGPDVFGINSGAALAVAIVMLCLGGQWSLADSSVSGYIAILLAAFVGAMAVTAVITFCARLVRSHTVLLIVGIMVGYLSGSAVSLLNFMATEEGVKSYMVWGMGSFGNVSLAEMPVFILLSCLGLMGAVLLVKPLNALLLGDDYAANLGFNVRRLRVGLLAVTGLLTAVVTAFCGPVAFIGLATPHIARLGLGTSNHRQLVPATLLMGSAIALLCNLLCVLPGGGGMVPLNAVTPLIGAPVIIYVLLK